MCRRSGATTPTAFLLSLIIATTWLLITVASARAQMPAPAPTPQQGGTFFEPPASVPLIYLPPPRGASSLPSPSEEVDPRLSLRLGLDFPLRRASVSGFATQGSPAGSPTAQADLRYTPWPGSGWFGQTTLYRYLRSDRQQPWNPDFTYSFGYDDWHLDTFSLVYTNYSGNRWRSDRSGPSRVNFNQGQWTLGYKFAMLTELEPVLLVGDGDAAACTANLHFVRRYADLASQSLRRNGISFSAGCRYTRPEGWYAALTLFAYPQRSRQQPWDPDFTYALGYFDWRPGTVSVQYSNYSGNRFPGRTRGAGEGLLRSGSISISWHVPL